MILQTSVGHQLETLTILCKTTESCPRESFQSLHHLRKRYRAFLSALGQREIDVENTQLSWITTDDSAGKLRGLFSNDSLLDDKAQAVVIRESRAPDTATKESRLAIALQELSLSNYEYGELFLTLITDIFVLPSDVAKGGSTSQAIGVVWANPKLTYVVTDLVEMLVHEFSHHAMFLDELRYGHYFYPLVLERSTWAHSAILNVRRPLDKVLHSIVVALEILLFRDQCLGHPAKPRIHPPTETLILQVENAIASTEEAAFKHPGIFQGRAYELLNGAKTSLHEMRSRYRPRIPPPLNGPIFAAV